MKECPKCKLPHNKRGVFCSYKCANSRDWSKLDRLKKSESAKNSKKVLIANQKNRKYFTKPEMTKICSNCGNIFKLKSEYYRYKTICCSRKCYYEWIKKSGYLKGKNGGYRKEAGRGKMGWYKGYYCNSSWELAWLIYQLDHNVKPKRNTEGFDYIFENKYMKFYPDFILNDKEYIEIKGWITNKDKEKIKQFKEPLKVLYKKDLKPVFDYVLEKYGKSYIDLYEK